MYEWTDDDIRHRPKLVLTALEVRRRHSEAMALDASDRQNFQRDRKCNTDWLDWMALFLRPMDEFTENERLCFLALYEPPKDWSWSGRSRTAHYADSKFWSHQPEELIIQGGKIASMVW